MATKNWVYGAKTPDVEQAVSDAIFSAHRYRNRLCELELAKRDRHYEILRSLAPEFVAAELAVSSCVEKLANAREAIQAERVKQQTKKPVGVERWTQIATQCKESLKSLRADCKAAKLASYQRDEVIAAMEANAAQHKVDCADAKSRSGLYWGTEATVRQACGSFSSGAPPKFKRYEGEGQLAVQLQGGLDCTDAERSNTLCYIGEAGEGRKRQCFIRIGSDSGKPVFARVPIVFHRPLPAGRIKWAYLERRKIASHVRWSIRLTIDCDPEPDRCRDGEVAIHTGWYMEPSGLRVCRLLGSDGQRGDLILSNDHCDDYTKLDTIRSKRDLAFNDCVANLRGWLKDRDVPEWLAEATSHLHQWKSPARLAKLYWQWSDDRIDGDGMIFHLFGEWRKSDKHLWQHERRLAVRIVRRRKDLFRNFTKRLADRYGVAIVSPIDAKKLAENSSPEDLERDNTQAHRHSKWASVSDLTQCLREKFPLHCIDVDCRNITRECCECGEVDDVSGRIVQCGNCGHTHDVDDNAVANILARGKVMIDSGALLELVVEQEVKASKQAEKLAKMQEANRGARERAKASKELQGQT